jgi:hypothetical protein
MNGKYENLRKQYPEYISLDQFRVICHVAKRSARFLVEHGIVPSIDTGRKTWRYKIAIEDTISYLQRREKFGSMIPSGSVSSRTPYQNKSKPLMSIMAEKDINIIILYFEQVYANYDDVLSVSDVAEMTGLCKKTIMDFLKSGEIKSITNHPSYIIPKKYLLDFVSSKRFILANGQSEMFKQIHEEFDVWLAVMHG